ncbi:hypothetical protein FRB98_001707 [Tulasnella sp. 332]|nr:hypothetical protein FRB98_001707 [Tulasnella sp. 332]
MAAIFRNPQNQPLQIYIQPDTPQAHREFLTHGISLHGGEVLQTLEPAHVIIITDRSTQPGASLVTQYAVLPGQAIVKGIVSDRWINKCIGEGHMLVDQEWGGCAVRPNPVVASFADFFGAQPHQPPPKQPAPTSAPAPSLIQAPNTHATSHYTSQESLLHPQPPQWQPHPYHPPVPPHSYYAPHAPPAQYDQMYQQGELQSFQQRVGPSTVRRPAPRLAPSVSASASTPTPPSSLRQRQSTVHQGLGLVTPPVDVLHHGGPNEGEEKQELSSTSRPRSRNPSYHEAKGMHKKESGLHRKSSKPSNDYASDSYEAASSPHRNTSVDSEPPTPPKNAVKIRKSGLQPRYKYTDEDKKYVLGEIPLHRKIHERVVLYNSADYMKWSLKHRPGDTLFKIAVELNKNIHFLADHPQAWDPPRASPDEPFISKAALWELFRREYGHNRTGKAWREYHRRHCRMLQEAAESLLAERKAKGKGRESKTLAAEDEADQEQEHRDSSVRGTAEMEDADSHDDKYVSTEDFHGDVNNEEKDVCAKRRQAKPFTEQDLDDVIHFLADHPQAFVPPRGDPREPLIPKLKFWEMLRTKEAASRLIAERRQNGTNRETLELDGSSVVSDESGQESSEIEGDGNEEDRGHMDSASTQAPPHYSKHTNEEEMAVIEYLVNQPQAWLPRRDNPGEQWMPKIAVWETFRDKYEFCRRRSAAAWIEYHRMRHKSLQAVAERIINERTLSASKRGEGKQDPSVKRPDGPSDAPTSAGMGVVDNDEEREVNAAMETDGDEDTSALGEEETMWVSKRRVELDPMAQSMLGLTQSAKSPPLPAAPATLDSPMQTAQALHTTVEPSSGEEHRVKSEHWSSPTVDITKNETNASVTQQGVTFAETPLKKRTIDGVNGSDNSDDLRQQTTDIMPDDLQVVPAVSPKRIRLVHKQLSPAPSLPGEVLQSGPATYRSAAELAVKEEILDPLGVLATYPQTSSNLLPAAEVQRAQTKSFLSRFTLGS